MNSTSVIFLIICAVIGWGLTMLFYAKVRRRLVHYV
jgi:hypothetical protein